MKNPFSRKKKPTEERPLEKPPQPAPKTGKPPPCLPLLTAKAKEGYTPTNDFTPEDAEGFRRTVLSSPVQNYGEIVGVLLGLTERYATLHCKIRFECSHKGDIAACLSCLSEQILVPDMSKQAGGKVAMWPAKR